MTSPLKWHGERSSGNAPGGSAESVALAKWYSSHASIRRLLAIASSTAVRIIVSLEPTIDSDDTAPVWFANRHTWLSELQQRINSPVALELIVDPSSKECELAGEGVVIVDLCWRDPCSLMNW